MAEGREVCSWAGAAKFEDGDIDDLILEGPIGTGPFGAMLLSLFEGHNARFFYEGDTTQGGRRLMQFSFTVRRKKASIA